MSGPAAPGEPEARPPRVSVVVPALDAAATIGRTLEALSRQQLAERYEVIVVDDGSGDSTAAIAEAARGPVRVLRQERSGPAAARNRGAAAARGEVVAFTDADCFPEPGWLRAGVEAIDAGADLVQGAVSPEPGFPMGPFDRSLWIDRENGLYETANLLVTRELFERIGGFEVWLEPDLGKPLAEDVWFGWRARRAGARTAFCPDARVHHAVFRRGAAGYVSERRRLRHFPAIAAKVPELRDELFYARLFLNRRSAALDLALAGAAAAGLARSPLPLAAALPYARLVGRHALAWRRRAGVVAAAELAADLVSFASLVRGSVTSRSPLL